MLIFQLILDIARVIAWAQFFFSRALMLPLACTFAITIALDIAVGSVGTVAMKIDFHLRLFNMISITYRKAITFLRIKPKIYDGNCMA